MEERPQSTLGRVILNQNIVLSLTIIAVLLLFASTGTLGLATVVLAHKVAEVIVIDHSLRAARTHGQQLTSTCKRSHKASSHTNGYDTYRIVLNPGTGMFE